MLALPLLHAGVVLADEPPTLQVAPAPPAPALRIEVAPPPPPQVIAEETGWRTTSVIGFEGGAAFVPGRSPGGFGRFMLTGREHNAEEEGLNYGWMMAVEAWRAKKAGGGALPALLYMGFEFRRVFASLDFGVNLCNFDILDGKAGGGVFSPRAGVHLGVRIADVYVALTADVQRRVMWKLDDITQFTFGLSFGFVYREKMSDVFKFT